MPEDIKTDAALLHRLREATKRKMTADEVRRQRISFVYGNLPHDSTLTRSQVEELLARLEGTAA